MKKISVFVTQSFGELDILIPLFYEIKQHKKTEVKFIITVTNIYEKLIKNKFYLKVIKELDIEVKHFPLVNKFNYNISNIKNSDYVKKNFFRLLEYYLSIKFIIKNFFIFSSDIIMHETTHQLSKALVYIILVKIFKKKTLIYHHGHSLNQKNFYYKPNSIIDKNSKLLLFHSSNLEWAQHAGYHNIHFLGFPKFFENWINYLKVNDENDIKEKYVVIFSRPSNNNYYMENSNYEYLFKSSCEAIKETLPEHKIYIKTHPREDIQFINSLINKYRIKNIEISYQNSLILSINAYLTISFWSSTILDSLSLNIPSVEFYIETENFKKLEPKGSLYKFFGIDSVNTKGMLINFINKCKTSKYEIPSFVKKLSNTKDISIFLD